MSFFFSSVELYDNLLRRVKLLGLKKYQTCTIPISIRLTEVENNIINDMSEIFSLNRSQIIKLCIRGAATQLAEAEQLRRFNQLLESE